MRFVSGFGAAAEAAAVVGTTVAVKDCVSALLAALLMAAIERPALSYSLAFGVLGGPVVLAVLLSAFAFSYILFRSLLRLACSRRVLRLREKVYRVIRHTRGEAMSKCQKGAVVAEGVFLAFLGFIKS